MKISITCGKNFSYDNDLVFANSRFVYVENYYGEIKRINRKTGEVYIVDEKIIWGTIDKGQLDMINRNLSNLE